MSLASASGSTAAAAAKMGRALCASFEGLLHKDLNTRPVAAAHALVARCMRCVEPTMTPYLFGSTAVYGYHEPGTDADFVVLSPDDVRDGKGADPSSEVAKGIQSDLLAKLTQALQHEMAHGGAGDRPAHSIETSGSPTGTLRRVELVRRTRVPVLRVTADPTDPTSVAFDVTANRRNGVRNSALLRGYFVQAPHTRWLGIAVKQWSKRSGLNMSVEGGCLTSYGFNLMVAYYLLRRGVVTFVPPESCDVCSIAPMPPYLPLTPPPADGRELGELTRDFLHFYAKEFDADREVVSLSRPGRTTREDLQWTKRAEDMARISGEKTSYRWCIEDPYEESLNVGRHVTPFKLMLLRKHLERAQDTNLLLDVSTPQPPSPSPSGKPAGNGTAVGRRDTDLRR